MLLAMKIILTNNESGIRYLLDGGSEHMFNRKRIIRICCISFLLLFFVNTQTFAGTPAVTGYTGIFSHNSSVTINGSNFGTKISGQATPLKWNDFNNALAEQKVASYDPYWSNVNNNYPCLVTDENKRVGNNIKMILQMNDPVIKVTSGGPIVREKVGFADTGKIYLNFWIYLDFGTSLSSNYFQIKTVEIGTQELPWPVSPMLDQFHFAYPQGVTQTLLANYRSQLNLTGNMVSGSNIITNYKITPFGGQTFTNGMAVQGTGIPANTTVTAFDANTITLSNAATVNATSQALIIYTGAGNTIYFPNNTFPRSNPSWQNYAMQAYMGDPGVANGSRWYWASSPNFNIPYAHVGINNNMILDAVASKLNAIKFGWYRACCANGTSVVHYDDIYIDNSWARVEIGNNADYNSCTHREIQIPSAWSNNSIAVNVKQGSFASSDKVYLFVVNEDGTPSIGYGPVTFGTGKTLPNEPKNFNGHIVK